MDSNTHHNHFLIWHFVHILTLVTWKLQVVCEHSTYWMAALLSEMSIFCDRAACEILLVNYGSEHASQSLSADNSFSHTYMHNLKTKGRIWTFCITNDCSIIGDIPCLVQSCMRDLTGELQPQTHIDCSLIQHCVYILTASHFIHWYLVCNYVSQQNSHSLWLYCTPNDNFTANDALFYKNKFG